MAQLPTPSRPDAAASGDAPRSGRPTDVHITAVKDPGEGFTKGGVDIACHDLIGKLLGVPVYALLGGHAVAEIAVEGLGYGIGITKGGNAHATDEWVDIESLVQHARLYADLATRILQ